jgi:hypothetical protein
MTPVNRRLHHPTRESIYVGQALRSWTPGRPYCRLSFEIPATANLGDASEGFADGAKFAFDENLEGIAGDAPAAGFVDRDSGRRRRRRAGQGAPPRGKIQFP